nr:predicted GPI-anchored protein 58 [Lolium perenne]
MAPAAPIIPAALGGLQKLAAAPWNPSPHSPPSPCSPTPPPDLTLTRRNGRTPARFAAGEAPRPSPTTPSCSRCAAAPADALASLPLPLYSRRAVAPAPAAVELRLRRSSGDQSEAAPPPNGSPCRPAPFAPSHALDYYLNRPIAAAPELTESNGAADVSMTSA